MQWIKILLAIVGIKVCVEDVVPSPEAADSAGWPVFVVDLVPGVGGFLFSKCVHMDAFSFSPWKLLTKLLRNVNDKMTERLISFRDSLSLDCKCLIMNMLQA